MPGTTPSPETLLKPEVQEVPWGKIGQLPRVTHYLASMFFKGQAVDLPLLGPPFQHIVWMSDGVITEKFDDPGNITEVDVPPMHPVPDGGGSHAI